MTLSGVYGSVTNNNGFWIGLLDLLTPSFTITGNHNQFTLTHNKCVPKTHSILTGLRLSSTVLTWFRVTLHLPSEIRMPPLLSERSLI
jgi:hypothetical protein